MKQQLHAYVGDTSKKGKGKELDNIRGRLRAAQMQLEKVIKERDELSNLLTDTMHESRKSSSLIFGKTEKLIKSGVYDDGVVKNIHFTCGLLSARLGFTEMELNPEGMSNIIRQSAGVYQKFDKARYLLNNTNDYAHVRINFQGNSNIAIDAIKAFDMLPFVVLQNAVKYSPPNQNVDVVFTPHNRNIVEVSVSSFGPEVSGEEAERLFERGFRGKNSAGHDGEGIGLYLAKRLCDFHGSSINVELGKRLGYEVNGGYYRRFKVLMVFENFKN